MPKTRARRRRRRQRGGLLPLAALIPALMAGGKPPRWARWVVPRGTGAKKPWKRRPLGRKRKADERGIKRERGLRDA